MPSDNYLLPFWWPYLYYNYLPSIRKGLPFSSNINATPLPSNFDEAAKYVGKVLREVVLECIDLKKETVIPLSGGLDSRAILAASLESGSTIHAVTFGQPGSRDYEYSKDVAKLAGVKHSCLTLEDFSPTTDDLVSTVKSGGSWTYIFDAYYNRLMAMNFASSSTAIIHGFAGDPVAGSHYIPGLIGMEESRKAFCRSQRFTCNKLLLPAHVDPLDAIPESFNIPEIPHLSSYEVIDFYLRQSSAIKPIVIDERYDVRMPFLDGKWMSCMLFAPIEWRLNCRLYERALYKTWPTLFSVSTKNHRGYGLNVPPWKRALGSFPEKLISKVSRSLRLLDPTAKKRMNYIDFRSAFLSSGSLYSLAYDNLEDLKSRKVIPWIDPVKILKEHSDGRKNYEKELQVLIGLEVNLKAL